MVPITSGTPTSANSRKPNAPTPASCAASEITTFTGLPVSRSRPPAPPAKANGMSSRDGGNDRRMAITTTMGTNVATEPFKPIKAVRTAASSMVSSRSLRIPDPVRFTNSCPTQVVTPVASSPSDTTNSAAMRMTAGSPKPAKASGRLSTPVANNTRAAPIATTSTGNRFHTNRATTPASVRSVIDSGLTPRS